jgi:hypothetical protein
LWIWWFGESNAEFCWTGLNWWKNSLLQQRSNNAIGKIFQKRSC